MGSPPSVSGTVSGTGSCRYNPYKKGSTSSVSADIQKLAEMYKQKSFVADGKKSVKSSKIDPRRTIVNACNQACMLMAVNVLLLDLVRCDDI